MNSAEEKKKTMLIWLGGSCGLFGNSKQYEIDGSSLVWLGWTWAMGQIVGYFYL